MNETINISQFRNLLEWVQFCETGHATLTPIPFGVEGAEMNYSMSRDEKTNENGSGTVIFRMSQKTPLYRIGHANIPGGQVDQYSTWYRAHGQDVRAGIGKTGMEYELWTQDRAAAIACVTEHQTL